MADLFNLESTNFELDLEPINIELDLDTASLALNLDLTPLDLECLDYQPNDKERSDELV